MILFYHPQCPCTLATARCLERLSAKFLERPPIHANAYCPENESEAWIESKLTQTLKTIQGVQVCVDRNGDHCRRIGAIVSGHILVYDVKGKLIFSGGITPNRGHEGDCRAAMSFLQCVNGVANKRSHWPVFGCPIVSPQEDSR